MLKYILVPAVTLFALWLLFSPGQGVSAQDDPPLAKAPAAQSGASLVKVGIYVVNIGRLDIGSGTFTVDFYMTLRCDEECDPTKFEFMNGRSPFVDLQWDAPDEKIYRIQATLTANLDLREYPFDSHDLTITIEDSNQTIEDLVYVVDPETSGIDDAVAMAGWLLDGGWSAEVDDHYYSPWDEDYSRYAFIIPIRRATLSAILKSFFPAIAIVATGLFALFISPTEILARLTINTSAFVGAVLFHLNLTSAVPPLGYLTYADKFMLVNYLALLMALVATVTVMFLARQGRDETLRKVHAVFLVATPTAWIILQLVNGYLR